jgi:hypothetical protein
LTTPRLVRIGHRGLVGAELLDRQGDTRCRERLLVGFVVEHPEQAFGGADRSRITGQLEHVAAARHGDPEAQLDLAQVFVEGPAQIGQALVVLGFEGERQGGGFGGLGGAGHGLVGAVGSGVVGATRRGEKAGLGRVR